jgi:hypothetical protein
MRSLKRSRLAVGLRQSENRNEALSSRRRRPSRPHFDPQVRCAGQPDCRRPADSHLRSFSVGNYVVFYRPMQSGVEVVRVIHAARDIGVQF